MHKLIGVGEYGLAPGDGRFPARMPGAPVTDQERGHMMALSHGMEIDDQRALPRKA